MAGWAGSAWACDGGGDGGGTGGTSEEKVHSESLRQAGGGRGREGRLVWPRG